MEKEQIVQELTSNPGMVKEILPEIMSTVLESEKIQEVIGNKAETIYKEKITEEVRGIHSQYDADMEEILGEKPGQLEDGTKQKTYDKIKSLYGELKELREQKGSLSVDAEVKRLQKEIERLKVSGPGSHWEQTFKSEQAKWTEEKNSLTARIQESNQAITDFKKKSDIEGGLRGLKFREDIPESARKALIDMAVNRMIKNSKIEDDKIIYQDENGAMITNSEYKPESAKGILVKELAEILATKDGKSGGGAPPVITGQIVTQTIDGKDVQKLQLSESSFKTKTEFIKVAEEALLKSGVVRSDPNWDLLKNEAYSRYNVTKLPR